MTVFVSKMVTPMLRRYDQDERQHDGSRHWDSVKPVLMKAFAQNGARDLDDGYWLGLNHDGSTKKRLEYYQDRVVFVFSEVFRDTLVLFQ